MKFTKLISQSRLSKQFILDEDGKLLKQSAAEMTDGFAQIVDIHWEALGDYFDNLNYKNAVTFGLPIIADGDDWSQVATSRVAKDNPVLIARTREYFQWGDRDGIMVLDIDYMQGFDTSESLYEVLCQCYPPLRRAPMLWRPSSSSGVMGKGISGQHFFVWLDDAQQIAECGKALNAALWAHKHGAIAISESGAMLVRSLVDTTVWQPERLMFVAPPLLGDGVTRTKYHFKYFGPLGEGLKLSETDLFFDADLLRRQIDAAKSLAKPDQEVVIERKITSLVNDEKITYESASKHIRNLLEGGLLPPDLWLYPKDKPRIKAGDLGMQWMAGELKGRHEFCDPFAEGKGDKRVAFLLIRSGEIYTHFHGGVKYKLPIGGTSEDERLHDEYEPDEGDYEAAELTHHAAVLQQHEEEWREEQDRIAHEKRLAANMLRPLNDVGGWGAAPVRCDFQYLSGETINELAVNALSVFKKYEVTKDDKMLVRELLNLTDPYLFDVVCDRNGERIEKELESVHEAEVKELANTYGELQIMAMGAKPVKAGKYVHFFIGALLNGCEQMGITALSEYVISKHTYLEKESNGGGFASFLDANGGHIELPYGVTPAEFIKKAKDSGVPFEKYASYSGPEIERIKKEYQECRYRKARLSDVITAIRSDMFGKVALKRSSRSPLAGIANVDWISSKAEKQMLTNIRVMRNRGKIKDGDDILKKVVELGFLTESEDSNYGKYGRFF
jgi:hypothetical protein